MDARKQKEGSYPELFVKNVGERLKWLTELSGLSWGSSPSASALMMTG